MTVPYTQYMRPDGRQIQRTKTRPQEIEDKAHKVIAAGYQFEAEVLTTGEVSFTVFDPRIEEDVEIEICRNGPELDVAFDKLVNDAVARVEQEGAPS